MNYNIAETFYSLQGEGVWTGTPMFFIRLAGCNINCDFCDTDYNHHYSDSVEGLVSKVLKSKAERVVITGGEPGLQDTVPLVMALHANYLKVHVETNGTMPLHQFFDWVAVSPKGPIGKLDPFTMLEANEIKFLIGILNWEQYIQDIIAKFYHHANQINNAGKVFWLMPLAKPYPFRLSDGLIEDNVKEAVQYCLDHPQFRLCMQLHKVLGIK